MQPSSLWAHTIIITISDVKYEIGMRLSGRVPFIWTMNAQYKKRQVETRLFGKDWTRRMATPR
jgi:hypothetical protein